jgi:hypothetical protein
MEENKLQWRNGMAREKDALQTLLPSSAKAMKPLGTECLLLVLLPFWNGMWLLFLVAFFGLSCVGGY